MEGDRSSPARSLPVPAGMQALPPALGRYGPPAAFVSQLLAERANLGAQRARRRAPLATALGAYEARAESAVLRMPTGYRTTIVA